MQLLFLVTASFLVSCSSGNNNNKQTSLPAKDSVVQKEQLKGGEVITMTVQSDASQHYHLYLPANYSTSKKYPVIVAFDAHGDGSLPVTKYKEIAEKYGYILAGSDNSKNGLSWNESATIANNLFTDLRARLSIDNQRFYLLGFSGGARIANGITILDGSIAGVICCGAAAPAINSPKPRSNYFFMGVVGTGDFNYPELRKYDMVDLAGYPIKHALITFDGKHEWPDASVMQQAVWWMELNQMRKDPAYKNEEQIQAELKPLLAEIEKNKKEKKEYENYLLSKKIINFYETLTDIGSVYKLWTALQSSPSVDKALKKQESLLQDEEKLKAFYVKSFQDQNENWWKNEISSLQKKMKNDADPDIAHEYQRILDYLSLVCYMQTNGALNQHQLAAADYFDHLYQLVDPANSEAYYFEAQIQQIKGNKEAAIAALGTSIEKGFKDKARLQNDTTFQAIQASPEFQAKLNSIKN